MTGAELLVRCLENEGLEHMFGVPGEENLAVLDALLDSKIHFLQTRHEQGAAFMANVQGRLTGKASVCLATLAARGRSPIFTKRMESVRSGDLGA